MGRSVARSVHGVEAFRRDALVRMVNPVQFAGEEEGIGVIHPSVRGCLQFLGIEDGIEIQHIADLPARDGLGTSSAFTVGLLLGLYALRDQMRDKHALAADAIHVEQELLQEAVGAQDQVSAAYGGFNRINFHQDGSIEVKRILISPSRLVELEQHSALYFTGFARTASTTRKCGRR